MCFAYPQAFGLGITTMLKPKLKETLNKSLSEIKYTRKGRVRGIYTVNRVIQTPKAHGTQKPECTQCT